MKKPFEKAKTTDEIPENFKAKTTDEILENFREKMEKEFKLGIPRNKLRYATDGFLNGRTMANRDCEGRGIPGRFKIGRQIAYPVDGTVEYLRTILTVA
ncbi:hypothetical protein SAMN02746065_10925 [Desulfocicer vacuolatum DSM 3385]|uniref:Uncharacterized protein n=1 Tax=Desulfocicer vacuolatum DSM 3385 TaxID=1121400 RepID=A0A1W2BPD7_9BACT|nr:hypothetical protein [Desulfocicer vacuolatum]SMC74733.1 hypothetical protein SAMN02746065_10925 [Desulfocicer vacuolatum DSM 3385]